MWVSNSPSPLRYYTKCMSSGRAAQSDLLIQMLWFSWKASGVFLSPLHTHQLHFSLCEAEYEARQQQGYGQSVGQGQAHQTWVEQHDHSTPGNNYLSHQIQPFLTWIDRTVLVLNDSYHPKTCHYSDTNQLQADVQPLHGSTAKKQASLVLLQTPGALPFKPEAKKVIVLLVLDMEEIHSDCA